MRAEIFITTEGLAFMEENINNPPPPTSEEYLFVNALLAIAKYDEYLDCVTPLLLERLMRKGYTMELTGLRDAKEILEILLKKRPLRQRIILDDEEIEEWP